MWYLVAGNLLESADFGEIKTKVKLNFFFRVHIETASAKLLCSSFRKGKWRVKASLDIKD